MDLFKKIYPKDLDDIIFYNDQIKLASKWLSNFNVANPLEYQGRKYPTIEHAFHAQKAHSDKEETIELFKDLFTIGKPSYIGDKPNDAKKRGGKTFFKKFGVTLIKGWDKLRVPIMRKLMIAYYEANPDLKQQLIETGNRPLHHAGFRIDSFWGMKGKKDEEKQGENMNGKLLMEIRDKFKKEAEEE